MASGNTILVLPGLTLPGYNGMDFQFSATINLGGGAGIVSLLGVPGPIMIGTNSTVAAPIITSADGGEQYTFYVSNGVYLTQGYELLTFTGSTATLKQPNGVMYSFTQYGGVYLVTRKEDPFGNALDYSRSGNGALTGWVQHVGNHTRTISYSSQTNPVTVTWSDGLRRAGQPADQDT